MSSAAADLIACRAALSAGSRSFFLASLLLPRRVRVPAAGLYAFCRLADDAIDLGSGEARLDALRERVRLVYEGRPVAHPADRAFTDVVHRFGIPRRLPEALLEGFAWDDEGRRYRSLADLEAYAARVAGSVGGMMALLMGRRAPEQLTRACELGIAMQLSNIARDVAEDARAGRLYLPLDWMLELGIDPDRWLAQPAYSPALEEIIRRILRAADRLYVRADAGIAELPATCRPGIMAARLLYAEIGREVERTGEDFLERRAMVSSRRKLSLLCTAVARAIPRASLSASSSTDASSSNVSSTHASSSHASSTHASSSLACEAVRFLVEAVVQMPPVSAAATISWWRVDRRLIWLIELFAQLEARERALLSRRLERTGT